MLSLAIRYLNGWAMAAADGAKKEQAEWPPHPDRVFMALAAAWFETGEDPAEGAALRWLEAQPAPAIVASDFSHRRVVTSYVPVNDAVTSRKPPAEHDLTTLKGAGLDVLPEFRSRQPRAFPVAIPHDPTVRLVWDEPIPDEHRTPFEHLLSKVTHVGHSASLVQAWIDDGEIEPTWVPTSGLAEHRLRVSHRGRLEMLKLQMNRDAWLRYHDLKAGIDYAKSELKEMVQPPRADWNGFPDVLILANETDVKQNPAYRAAKSGDAHAAAALIGDLVTNDSLESVRRLVAATCEAGMPTLVAAHAYEHQGVNAIPSALAEVLSEYLRCDYAEGVVQTNVVFHTGADGYGRLARQAVFDGKVEKGRDYLLVDDFVGQGGTLANLRGHIIKKGGRVAAAVVLSGKPYSAKLSLTTKQLDALRQRHGRSLEQWWKEHFGHSFNRLTQSEARYLTRSPDAEQIRDRIAAAKRPGDSGGHARSPKEQKSYLKQLEAQFAADFPHGIPASQRPGPGRWQGYGRPQLRNAVEPSGNLFDPRLVVLRLTGKRLSLPACLKLTAALRGALMKACPDQPPPEWFSGHTPDGKPSRAPHLALVPLPFVGAPHADGRIMGVALALPAGLDSQEAARCLAPFLVDRHGLPAAERLFDGQWFECGIELENRERPPESLRAARWTRASRTWASVTPVVLDRHHDGNDKWERAAEEVKGACERIGLPRPRKVMLHPVSLAEGAPHARDFPHLIRKSDGGRRHHSHAVLIFDEPVRGPVTIGAGRFRGYGLCLPVDDGSPEYD